MDDFIVFGQPQIEQDEIDEVVDSLKNAWLGTGPKVNRFERDFAAYKGVQSAVAVSSCTAALHLSCDAIGLLPGDEVIVPAMTFCASINAIIHAGATPVLADVDPDTQLISGADIEHKVTDRTKAIMIVHFAGRPCDMDGIMACARKHDLSVIEDCAHAIETEYHGRPAGTFGDFGCFSFYATKNVATGEGGMVIGRDPDMLSDIQTKALHGLSHDAWKRFSDEGYRHYFVISDGFKNNMMDLQAAIGIHQLKRIEKNWRRRAEIWQAYMDAFSDLDVVLPPPQEADTRHGMHLFTIRIPLGGAGISRDMFLHEMTRLKIGTGVHYLSMPEHPYYQERFGWMAEDYPHAMAFGRETASLPLSAKLTDGEVDRVIEAVRQILAD